jgi:hypothetical protein
MMRVLKQIMTAAVVLGALSVGAFADVQKHDQQKPPKPPREIERPEKQQPPPQPRNENRGSGNNTGRGNNDNRRGRP